MNWIKENPFAVGVLAVTVVGVGALTFLCVQKAGALSASNATFAEQKSKYDSLIAEPIFPSQANLKKVQDEHKAYIESVKALREELNKREQPLTNMSATAFADKLRKAVTDTRAAAQSHRVALPDEEAKFYLGFPAYQSAVPTEAAVPELNLQLDTIRSVVDKAIAAGVTSIDEIKRDPLPVEGGSQPAAPAAASSGNNRPAGRNTKPVEVVQRTTFAVSFTADQNKVQQTLNAILDTPQYVTVQLARFENEQLKGPAKGVAAAPAPAPEGEVTPPAEAPAAAPGTTPETAAPTINFILGEEKVKVTARFQIIRIPQPEPAAKS
jgi:hypothetical protein